MEQKIQEMQALVNLLNEASTYYYSGKGERMTDYEWDAAFDKLRLLEEETGTVLPDSPTNKVSEEAIVGQKEEHEFPALSLAKTKNAQDLVKWADGKAIWISWKLDGLTLVVTYDGGKLSKVVTRGNGTSARTSPIWPKPSKEYPTESMTTGMSSSAANASFRMPTSTNSSSKAAKTMPTRAIWRRGR